MCDTVLVFPNWGHFTVRWTKLAPLGSDPIVSLSTAAL